MIQRANEPRKTWTAQELLQMPPVQRDEIMRAAAAIAEADYCDDPELTAFDAFAHAPTAP